MYSVVDHMPNSIPSLAEFELYVMLALTRLEDAGYGAAVRREIEERTGRDVSIGAVYATLGRLQDKELLSHFISAPTPVQGGRARKLYHLTDLGQEAVRQATFRLERMMDGLVADNGAGSRR